MDSFVYYFDIHKPPYWYFILFVGFNLNSFRSNWEVLIAAMVLFDYLKPYNDSCWTALMMVPSRGSSALQPEHRQRSAASRGVKPWMSRLGKAVMRVQWTARRRVRNKCTVNGGIPVVRAKKYQSAPFTATAEYTLLVGGWTWRRWRDGEGRVRGFTTCLLGLVCERLRRQLGWM